MIRIEGRKAVLTDTGNALLRQSTHLLNDAQRLEQLTRILEQATQAAIGIKL